MTFPNRPTSVPSNGAHLNVTPSSALTPDEIASIAAAESRHVDYNLHPLRVQGLDHYIDSAASDERFHIS